MHRLLMMFVISAAFAACAGLTVDDLANMDEDTIDSVPFAAEIAARSAEEISGGCMGVKKDLLSKLPKDEKGAKATSNLCGYINREPCEKEQACMDRCKAACKEDALAKIM